MKTLKAIANIAHPSNNSKGICENPTHGHGTADNYLEEHDKSYSHRSTFYNHTLRMHVPKCIRGFGHFRCLPCMTDYFRLHLCGKEWCETCGEKMSWIHKRRIARWYDKWAQMETLGYLIITTPIEFRDFVLSLEAPESKKVLQHLRRYWVRKLKAEFDGIKGLCRYHWAGDDGKRFAPHLNFLFNKGYIEKDILNRWRNDYYNWLKDNCGIKVAAGTTNLRYRYCTEPAARMHRLKYVTRATLMVYRPKYAKIIHKFKNSINFGKFDKPKTNTKELSSLEACRCPECHTKLEHIEFIRPDKVRNLPGNLNDLDGGWFRHNLLDRGG